MAEKQSLSQSDFRKLLQTPRPADATLTPRVLGASGLRPKPPSTPRATPTSADPYIKPALPVRKKKTHKPSGDDHDDNGKEGGSVKYRDRAAERRTGKAGDYASTETILSALNATLDEGEIDAKTLYEQSKFLGGDEEHTHLVKGLDYALLRKVRGQLGDEEKKEDDRDVEMELEDALEGRIKDVPSTHIQEADDEKPEITAPLASKIYRFAVVENQASVLRNHPKRNELFLPGRMAFVFQLPDETGAYGGDPFVIPTAIIRSKADVAQRLGTDQGGAEDENALVIEKVARVWESLRKGAKDDKEAGQEKSRKKKEKEKEKEKEVRKKELIVGIADDEDIFADAGRDYKLDIDEDEDEKDEHSASYTSVPGTSNDVDMEDAAPVQGPSMPPPSGSHSGLLPEDDDEDLSQFMPPAHLSAPTTAPPDDDEEDLSQFMAPPHLTGPTTAPGYEEDEDLSRSIGAQDHAIPAATQAPSRPRQSYFAGLDRETTEDIESERQSRAMKENVKSLLRQVTARDALNPSSSASTSSNASTLPAKRPLEKDGDPDEADYNTFGLGGSSSSMRAEAYDDAIDSGDDEDWRRPRDRMQVDSGPGRNDKEGKKKGRREMSDRQKLDRDWEKVSKVMEEKFGEAGGEGGRGGRRGAGEGGKNRRERRAEMRDKGKR